MRLNRPSNFELCIVHLNGLHIPLDWHHIYRLQLLELACRAEFLQNCHYLAVIAPSALIDVGCSCFLLPEYTFGKVWVSSEDFPESSSPVKKILGHSGFKSRSIVLDSIRKGLVSSTDLILVVYTNMTGFFQIVAQLTCSAGFRLAAVLSGLLGDGLLSGRLLEFAGIAKVPSLGGKILFCAVTGGFLKLLTGGNGIVFAESANTGLLGNGLLGNDATSKGLFGVVSGGLFGGSTILTGFRDLIQNRVQEIKNQLVRSDSNLLDFSREMHEIFENPPSQLEDNSSFESNLERHALRDIDSRNPFDFSNLASQLEEFEIVNLTSSLGGLDNLELMKPIADIVMGMLRGQQQDSSVVPRRRLGSAEERNLESNHEDETSQYVLDRLAYIDDDTRATVRELGGFVLGRLGLLNNVLGGLSPLSTSDPPISKILASKDVSDETPPLRGMSESLKLDVEEIDNCIMLDAEVIGTNFLVVRGQDIWHCQELCKQSPRCKFVTLRQDEKLCYQYSDATSLSARRSSMTAPKVCQSDPNKSSVSSSEPISSAPLGQVLSGQSSVVPSGLVTLLGGTSMTSALSAASSVMTTGSQLMQALPLKELAQAGMQLSESGYLRNRGVTRGGPLASRGARDKSSMPPPPGIGNPSVNCRGQGLTCCVPRQAVPDWQTRAPYLNDYDIPACRSVYVSATDQMCVTSSYEGLDDEERCGLSLTELNPELKIFRHILTIPNKNINNAICECIDDHTGSARWEYSKAAVDELRTKLNETEATAQKLVKGANAAVALTQILANGGGNSPTRNNPNSSQSPSNSGPVQNAGSAMAAFGNAMNMFGSLGSIVKNRG